MIAGYNLRYIDQNEPQTVAKRYRWAPVSDAIGTISDIIHKLTVLRANTEIHYQIIISQALYLFAQSANAWKRNIHYYIYNCIKSFGYNCI